MASEQTIPNETVKNIIKGLLWQDWLKTELIFCIYFAFWFVSSFFLMTFILPSAIIFLWTIYAVLIASFCNIGEKEFCFCLPPKRTWQYLAHMLTGLATTLWLSVASLLTMALYLPQLMWRYIGSIFYDPLYLTDTAWYMLALTVIGPVLSFIFAYVFNSALVRNRYAAILSGILSGITGPWIFFMVGISIEWLIWKNGPTYKDGITTGFVSIPLMVLAGIGLFIHGYFHVRQSDASAGAGIRKKWYLAGGIAVFVIMTCISGIMAGTRSEYQEEKQRMMKRMRYEHQEEKSQPIIVPPKVLRIFKQVCEKGDYPRWQGYGESRNKSSEHEGAGIKILLILFLVAIPPTAWHVMQRWFSDSNLILKKRRIFISRPTRVKLLVAALIVLGLAAWSSMKAVQQQYERYREPLSQTMLVPTLPSPIPEKPEQGDQFEADQGRFLVQILVIRDLDMHPVYAKTYDIRGPLKERKPIRFELKLNNNNKPSEYEIKLEKKMWSSENMEEPDEFRFVVSGKLNMSDIFLTNDVPIFDPVEYIQTINNTFSPWYGRGVAGVIGYAVPVSEDDPLKKITVEQFLTQKQAGIARLLFQEYFDFNRYIGAPKIIEWMLPTGVIKWLMLLAFGLLLFAFAHRLWSLPVSLTLFMLLILGLDTWYVSQQGKILFDPAADPADRKCAAVLLDGTLFCDAKAGALFKRFVEDPEQPDELKHTLYGLTARRTMNPKNDWPVIRQRMAYPTVERAKKLLDWANASHRRLYIPEQTCIIMIRGFTKHHRDPSHYLPPVPGKASKTGLFIFGYSSVCDGDFVTRLPDDLQYERLSWDGRYIHMTFKVRPAYAEKLEIDSTQSLTALLTFSEIIGPVLHKKSETVADNISTENEQSVSTENEQMDFLSNFFVERARSGPPEVEAN